MEGLKEIVRKALMDEMGLPEEEIPEGEKQCPFCGVIYVPKHHTKAEAFATEDLES